MLFAEPLNVFFLTLLHFCKDNENVLYLSYIEKKGKILMVFKVFLMRF